MEQPKKASSPVLMVIYFIIAWIVQKAVLGIVAAMLFASIPPSNVADVIAGTLLIGVFAMNIFILWTSYKIAKQFA